MNKVCLTQIRDDIYNELKIIPIPMLERIFSIGKSRTPEEVILACVKSTLLTFERYYPVKLTLKCPAVQCFTAEATPESWVNLYYGESGGNYIKFYDNVEQVFYNLLPESELQMIPLAVKRLQMSFGVSHPTDYRQFEYQKPYLYGAGLQSYPYFSGIFKYPVIVDKRDTDVVKLEKCWVLFLFYGDDTYRTFKAALVCRVIDEIMDLKENFDIPGLPINVFNALPKIRERAERLVQMEYTQAGVSWGWD